MSQVTVDQTLNSADAQLVRSRLDAASLHPSVEHEYSALSLEGGAFTSQGILVQVPEDEAEFARAILTAPAVPPVEE